MTKDDPPDWSYKSPEELINAGITMHPTGSCTCGNEGECTWCMMDFYRAENERIREQLRDLRKWVNLNIQIPLRMANCMGDGPAYPVEPFRRMLKKIKEIEDAK